MGYKGCFQDCNPRTFPYHEISNSMTPEMCQDTCAEKGYAYAGVQFHDQCWCGNSLPPVMRPDTECNAPCKGDNSKMCGGGCRNSVYKLPSASGKDDHIRVNSFTSDIEEQLGSFWLTSEHL